MRSMRSQHTPRLRPLLLLVPAALSACGSPQTTDALPPVRERASAGGENARLAPAVIINGTPLSAAEFAPLLEEASGGAILEEVALDRLLAEELRRRAITLPPDAVTNERRALLATLAEEAGVDENAAFRLLEDTRRRRGLGPRRFALLLERNAALRALVQDSVEVADAEIALAHRIRDGERRLLRIIALPDERRAAELRDQLLAGPPDDLSIRFAQAAVDRSTDPSGAAGGLLGPISTSDPAYPSALRTAAAALQTGEVSPVIPIGGSSVIVLLERVLPPTGRTLEESRGEIAGTLRLRKERLAMERLARDLVERAEISVLDRDIGWSWDARRGVER